MKGRSRVAVFLAMTILVCALTATTDESVVEATSTTQQQLNQVQQEKNELEDKLDEANDNLEGLKNTQTSLQGELNNLNNQLTQVSDNLADLEQQIADKEVEIAQTQAALDEAKATEEWQYECMVIRVREMYERNDTSYLNAIVSAGSLSEMLNVADYFEKIAAYDQKMLAQYKENRQLIEEQEALLQSDRAELENLKVAAEAEKSKVSGLISQTSNSIADYADQIADAEARAEAYEAELKKKEEDEAYLKKKLAEELAMSQQAANSAWRNISEVSFAEGDRYLLANLIYCEAGGEPYEGKLAVGSVVINRVLSSVYPDSVTGVIYQNRQFSPVASGRLALALSVNKANADCYRAADEAMSGVTNVGSCLYFRTPIPELTGINIGGHVFY
uniref:cell wall hydrolase n=1 Tax=Acetatifactor sp. TaxID=1872090 RepID=UPI004056461E